MRKTFTKLMSVLLVFAMLFSTSGITALATDIVTTVTDTQTTTEGTGSENAASGSNQAVEAPISLDSSIQNNVSETTPMAKGTNPVTEITMINSVADLQAFAASVNGGNDYAGKTVSLAVNLILTGVNWTPIGNGTRSGAGFTGNAFKGTFDGGNRTIEGLTAPLFGVVTGTVKDVNLIANINDTTNDSVGAAVAVLVGGTVDDVDVSGTVTAPEAAGGVVGRVLAIGEVKNCDNTAAVTSKGSSDAAGGIVGKAYYTSTSGVMNITNCTNTGTINSGYAAGGIVGFSAANISGCTNSGAVTGNSGTGGIIGEQTNYGTVNQNSNTGAVNGYCAGGIVGWTRYQTGTTNYPLTANITISDNENTAAVITGTYSAGGIAGLIYNQATVTGNTNKASSIGAEGCVFAGGIVGGLQQENNNADIPGATFTVSGNTSTTTLADIKANCVSLVAYNNAPADETFATIENNTVPVETPVAYVAFIDTDKDGEQDDDEIAYTDLQAAIVAAAPAGTVELLDDVTVDQWIMFAETLNISSGQIITLNINGLTINGNNHTLTINSIESAGNGGYLFFDATKLNINNLTIKYADGVVGGIGLKAGTLNNVTFNGCVYGVMPQTGAVVIQNCTFKTTGTSIYFEEERDGLTVTGCTFENASDVNVILLRGDVEFTNNTVVSGRTVNVVSGSPVVTGNNFNDVRLKVYNGATATIENNTINVLAFNDATVPQSTFTNNTLSTEAQAALNAVKPAPTPDLTISTAEQLFAFAAAVNGGNEFSGKLVVLANNVDLQNVLWTPIGANGDSSPKFRGTFDGQGNTISNLKINQGAAYHAAGLFGATNGTIKNLTINGASVESLSSGSATVNGTAVVAGTTAYGATIENVHVKNATVKGNRYVAGIVGYMDGVVTGCSIENVTIVATPDNLTGSYDNGDKVGGIVGYCNSGANEISNCELKGTVSLTAYRDVAGIVGCASTSVKVNGNTNSATLTVTIDQITNSYGEKTPNAGEFVGRNTPAESTGNVTAENATYQQNTVSPAPVAKIGDQGYESVSAALDAAYNAGMKDVVITLTGETSTSTTDSVDLYNKYGNGTAFNTITFKQEDASKAYYLKNLFTGWTTGKVVFDGVNIVVTNQLYAIGKVELTNNSTIVRPSDITNYVFYGDMVIEPGSKFNSLVDRISSGSSLTVDGGKTDGNINSTADYKTVWLYVEDGNTMTIKNGAYVIVSNYEYAELEVSGTVNVQDSRLDVFTAIRIGENGVFNVDGGSDINTKSIIGSGKIILDAEGLAAGAVSAFDGVNLSGFTGTVELENATGLGVEFVDGKLTLVKNYESGTWGGIDWTLTSDGTLTISPTKGTPVADPNSGKTYEVGAWREAVRYDSTGEGKAIEGWPYDRTKVKTLIIEEGVTSIGSFTAQGFTSLTGEVVIPSTVTYIGQEAFQKSTFTKLTFAAGGTEELCIAQGAFKNLIIEEVALPDDRPVHLHAWVFNNCHNLKNATLPATLVSVHGTNHIDYFKDFNAHSNASWTKSSEIFAYDEKLETITFGSKEVMDMFYANNNGTSKDYTVANVGLTTYCDLEDAFEAAKNGEIVTLIKNVTVTVTANVPADATVVLDLNGKTLTGSILAPNADLTVQNGTIKNTNASVSAIEINAGTLAMTNVNIDSARHGVRIDGEVTAIIDGGTYRSAIGVGTGTYHALNIGSSDSGNETVTIKNGTFVGPKGTTSDSGAAVNVQTGATVTIEGGSFSGGKNNTLAAAGTLTVYGGTFDQDPTAYVAEGYKAVNKNGTWTVKEDIVLSGSGTETDPYIISNLKELKAFRDYVNDGITYADQYVKLTADIDLTGEVWIPIGTSNYDKTPTDANVKMFAGNFDGGDYIITGLSSDGYVPDSAETGSTEYSFGLFGYVYGANISNVKLANVNIDCGTRTDSAGNEVYGSGIAALIGYYFPANGKTTVISNCHVLSGTVKASNNMGGLIGHMDSQLSQPAVDITIENCSNAADVTTEAREAGGILGLMNSAREGNYYVTMRGTVTFKNCVNTGDITSLGGGAPSAGGILGRDHNQAAGQRLKIVFDNCENSGTITVTANGETHAAGIGAGYYSAGAWLIAKDCTNTGNVVVNNTNSDVYAGGLISYGGVVELINSTSTGTVTGGIGNTYVGGAQNILFLEKMDNFTDTVNGYTYYLNGGTSPEYAALVDDADYGGNFHLVETAYKTGCEFGGWYDNAALNGEAYTALNKNVKTYYAKWIGDEPVAQIGTTTYTSLQAAIDKAENDDTIVVLTNINLADCELQTLDGSYDTYFLVEGKSVTIDLNEKTISGEYTGDSMLVGVFSTDNGGHLTLTGNGTVDVTATNTVYSLFSNYSGNGGSITIENGTYKLDKASNCLIHTAVSANEGIGGNGVIVNGGSFHLGNVGTGTNGSPWIFNANGNGERHVWVTGGTYNADVFHQHYAWEVQYPDNKSAIKNNGNGTWTVVDAVAYIGHDLDTYLRKTGYETFADALNAVQDGETITVLDVEGSERKTEIDFDKAITFTITGNSDYELPTITFTNATVNIVDADIEIGELDARQNATINVKNSTVETVGGSTDGIVKAYYNGKINIEDSEVYAHQFTVMGVVNLIGFSELTVTWQTNVYGNGLITIGKDATLNTAAMHLTGKDYSGRDNTDADRVGKPAQITVDGGTLNVGTECISINGADYNYHSSYGINIGTIAGKKAVLDILNGAKVNIYMADGETANIGADGTVNVNGTLTVGCRKADGTATLVNNGSVVLKTVDSVVTANECGNVTTDVVDHKVVYENGSYKVVEMVCVAQIEGGAKYESLADAIKFAKAGDTIKLLADITEDVTVNKSITIDGAEQKYTGTMTVNTSLTVTVQNVNFVKGCITEVKGTGGNLTVKNCDFDGVDNTIAYAVTMRGGNSVTIEGCSVKNYDYGMLYVPSAVSNVKVSGTTASGMGYGVHVAYGTNITLENVKMTDMAYGIMTQNYGAKTITINNCEILGTAPIYVWEKATAIDTFVFEGTNSFGTTNFTVSTYANLKLASGATLAACDGFDVTAVAEDECVIYADGKYQAVKAVAEIVGGDKYATVSAALADAKADETVKMLADANESMVMVVGGVTLDLNGKTLTANYLAAFAGNHVVDDSDAKAGLLKISDKNIVLAADNAQMPVYSVNDQGYRFDNVTIDRIKPDSVKVEADSISFQFSPKFETLRTLIGEQGAEKSNIQIIVKLSWPKENAPDSILHFEYTNDKIAEAYKDNKYFTITISGLNPEAHNGAKVFVMAKSTTTNVEMVSDEICTFPNANG